MMRFLYNIIVCFIIKKNNLVVGECGELRIVNLRLVYDSEETLSPPSKEKKVKI